MTPHRPIEPWEQITYSVGSVKVRATEKMGEFDVSMDVRVHRVELADAPDPMPVVETPRYTFKLEWVIESCEDQSASANPAHVGMFAHLDVDTEKLVAQVLELLRPLVPIRRSFCLVKQLADTVEWSQERVGFVLDVLWIRGLVQMKTRHVDTQ